MKRLLPGTLVGWIFIATGSLTLAAGLAEQSAAWSKDLGDVAASAYFRGPLGPGRGIGPA